MKRFQKIGIAAIAAILLIILLLKSKTSNAMTMAATPKNSPEHDAHEYNRTNGKTINPNVLTYQKNNPGALRWFGDKWQGLDTKKTTTVGGFCVFNDLPSGIRAHAKLIKNYITLKGLNTLKTIISTYAPTADKNNPSVYANFVAKNIGISVNDIIDHTDLILMSKICYYMHIMEAGFAFVDAEDYEQAYKKL